MKEKIDIKLTREEVGRVNQAHDEFHYAYGIAMAQWGGLERSLYYWFLRAIGVGDVMARGLFYSAKSFSGRVDMLEAAIEHSKLTTEQRSFIKAAIKKAGAYSGTRNRLAHGEPIMNIVERTDPRTSDVVRSINYSIVQGKHTKPNPEYDVSIEQLLNAGEHFHQLQLLIMDALERDAPLAEYLRKVGELPARADAKVPGVAPKG